MSVLMAPYITIDEYLAMKPRSVLWPGHTTEHVFCFRCLHVGCMPKDTFPWVAAIGQIAIELLEEDAIAKSQDQKDEGEVPASVRAHKAVGA